MKTQDCDKVGKGKERIDAGTGDRELERRLADWARGFGVDYGAARSRMTDGDVSECIRYLRIARERKDRREAECVLFYLSLKSEEARLYARSSDQ